MATRAKIEKNLQRLRENIAGACAKSRRQASEVRVIAVTKTVGLEEIKSAVDLGLVELGESRVQQLLERSAELSAALERRRAEAPPVRWHMIGHLQRNKVKALLDAGVRIIHSVDSLRLAEEISQRAQKMETTVDILLEVNCSQEPQKFGVAVGASACLAEMVSTLANILLVGLMTMAPQVTDAEETRPTFTRLRELFEEIRHSGAAGDHFTELSMGMSQDYPIAVEEGATLLRIGTALFE